MRRGMKRTKRMKRRASKYLRYRNARDAYWKRLEREPRSAFYLQNAPERLLVVKLTQRGWDKPEGYYR